MKIQLAEFKWLLTALFLYEKMLENSEKNLITAKTLSLSWENEIYFGCTTELRKKNTPCLKEHEEKH